MTVLTSQQCTEFRPAESSFHFFFWERRFLAAILGPGWRSVASDVFGLKAERPPHRKNLLPHFDKTSNVLSPSFTKYTLPCKAKRPKRLPAPGGLPALFTVLTAIWVPVGETSTRLPSLPLAATTSPLGRA
jgi:hypothetical protein